MNLLLTSSAFQDGNSVPVWYTRAEIDCSPPVGWAGVPDAAESLALICSSRGGKGNVFYHWVVYNIPPDVHGLDGKQAKDPSLHKGICQSRNSAGGWGWEGPDINRRKILRFRLLALDAVLDEDGCGDPGRCVRSMEGHLLAEAALVGRVGNREERAGKRPVEGREQGEET